ncbi:uncharacterized protein LOC132390266 isoform X1 [Hypanus sabinus]|uniref:uncharacterized protein LOC132390266 isoform X1 n=2 Tax=Hypanus sabinus TaxID=79690 RepID=UPI0028C39CBB|nr:uncharacterized protein LOC132390266 isoform X1 [Hypanus sabinus]
MESAEIDGLSWIRPCQGFSGQAQDVWKCLPQFKNKTVFYCKPQLMFDPPVICFVTEKQKLITLVLTMGQCAGRGGLPVPSTSGKDTGPGSVISELLASWDDFQLLQLTDFYRDRLEQAMEGRVPGVSLALKAEKQFSREEHRKISDLADKGERADSSKFLLSLVMEKGSHARRVMWETFVKMWNDVPMLDKILNEILIYGCDPSHRSNTAQGLIKVLSELKDVQQKHMETLRAQTETLRVNTILVREKVKVFQLVDRYAEKSSFLLFEIGDWLNMSCWQDAETTSVGERNISTERWKKSRLISYSRAAFPEVNPNLGDQQQWPESRGLGKQQWYKRLFMTGPRGKYSNNSGLSLVSNSGS